MILRVDYEMDLPFFGSVDVLNEMRFVRVLYIHGFRYDWNVKPDITISFPRAVLNQRYITISFHEHLCSVFKCLIFKKILYTLFIVVGTTQPINDYLALALLMCLNMHHPVVIN
jgi:hypothetical protein